jgi:anti-sigma regulatory factor (Ser/Thr protein kinase)
MTECTDGSRAARRVSGPLHAAVVYDSDDALGRRAAPFVRDGLDRGETILAVVPSQVERVLRSVLGGDGAHVHWREPGLAHRRMGETYEDCRAYLAEQHATGRPTRLLTGNDLDRDADPDRLNAYLRFEAASTAVFRPYGFPWVCLYDRRRHPPRLVDHVGEVHPQLLLAGGRPADSPDYVDPARYLETRDGWLSTVPDPTAVDLPVATPGELRAARRRLQDYASSVDDRPCAAERVAVASHEVIGNALRHGRPPCRVRAWRSAGVLHVRVDDGGSGVGLATAGYGPPATPAGPGMGLWVTRQLTDVVHTRAGSIHGTAVELQFR